MEEYSDILLNKPEGKPGRQYLKSRNITKDTAIAWHLGYCLFAPLSSFPKRNCPSPDEILHFFCRHLWIRFAKSNILPIFAVLTEMVRLVQLVEHQIVVLGVVGSSPTSHPNWKERMTDKCLSSSVFLCDTRRNPRVALFYGICRRLTPRLLEKRGEKVCSEMPGATSIHSPAMPKHSARLHQGWKTPSSSQTKNSTRSSALILTKNTQSRHHLNSALNKRSTQPARCTLATMPPTRSSEECCGSTCQYLKNYFHSLAV